MQLLRNIADVSLDHLGNKASRIARLARDGFLVPESLIVDRDVVDRVTKGEAALSASLHEELTLFLSERPGKAFVFRSSSSSEDLPFASAAGQYDSFLGIRTADQAIAAVRACGRLVNDQRIAAYLYKSGFRGDPPTMTVLIQEMIFPDVAGVLYTEAPGKPDEMLAEYVAGLGTPVVAGTGHPEQIRLMKHQGVADTPAMGGQLLDLGLRLSEYFKRPQDIEWGMKENQLVVFQSRDIIQADLPLRLWRDDFPGVTVKTVSNGIAVGRTRYVGSQTTDSGSFGKFDIAVLEEGVEQRIAQELLTSGVGGILLPEGGVLSHYAAVCRQFGIPAAVLPETERLEPLRTIVLDADLGRICYHEDLHPEIRKHQVFDAISLVAARNTVSDLISRRWHLEAVAIDQEVVLHAFRQLSQMPEACHTEYLEEIHPHDYFPRAFCGISARVQRKGSALRLQFVRSNYSSRFREDDEVIQPFDDLTQAKEELERLSYVPGPVQQRFVHKVQVSDAAIYFNLWPGASGVYLSIDARDHEHLVAIAAALEIPQSLLLNLNGKDLFEHFGIRLDGCRFESVPISFAHSWGLG
jgi:phosphohistidine swiveling domain-containing protein